MSQLAIPVEIPIDIAAVIQRMPTVDEAVDLCIRVSHRNPKEIYIELEIDKGHWSHMQSGQANFPLSKLEDLMDICGNDIPLQWLAWRRGKGLHLLESEQQRLMRQKDEEIAELSKQLEWTKQLVRA